MSHELKGNIIIINNVNFTRGPPRSGSDKDVKALLAVFTQLGFNPIIYSDLTAKVRAFILMDKRKYPLQNIELFKKYRSYSVEIWRTNP